MKFYRGIPSSIYPQSNHDNVLDDHTRFLKWIKCTPVKERPHWMENVEVGIGIFLEIPVKRARKRGARFSGC